MRLKVDMTLNANTALRFREAAERLAHANLGSDGLLAAKVLSSIAESYDRAAVNASQSVTVDDLDAESDEWRSR
jgi:hypothetical protein